MIVLVLTLAALLFGAELFLSWKRLVDDVRGGFQPQLSGQGGFIGNVYGPSTDLVSPATFAFGPNNTDTLVIPTTWAAAGTLSIVSDIDGAYYAVLDPRAKLTAANTLTITAASGKLINNAASLVLNAAGAGSYLRCVAGAATGRIDYQSLTVP